MGVGEGFVKYVIFILLSPVGLFCMYIYGGGIITFINTLGHLFSERYIKAVVTYFFSEALPPSSIKQIILQPIVGALTAGAKWALAMSARGIPL